MIEHTVTDDRVSRHGPRHFSRSAPTSLLALLFTSLAHSDVPLTQTPFTYEIDYKTGQATDIQFRERFEESVPDLFHAGSDARFLGRFGFGGVPFDSRKTPYRQFVKETRAYTHFLHEKGVRWVIPYICNQTIIGNDKTRMGVWEVYDHWENFGKLGLGHKPPDPIEWMQRQPSGNLHYNYMRMWGLERKQPMDVLRYAPCPNNPHWRRLCNNEARLAAEVGFDGMFVDNCIIHCYCSSCQSAFQAYLKATYSPSQLKEAFGVSDYRDTALFSDGDIQEWARSSPDFVPWLEEKYPPAERRIPFDTTGPLDPTHIDNAGGGMLAGEAMDFVRRKLLSPRVQPTFESLRLANPAMQNPVDRLRWAETTRFWAFSIGDMLREMKKAGQSVKPGFFIVPNWGTMQRVVAAAGRAETGKDMRRWKTGADWQMFEEGFATGILSPGVVLDYDMELRFAFANGVRALLLPYNLPGRDIAEVAVAETAASGGAVVAADLHRYPDLQRYYGRFFVEHRDLFEGYRSAARVALAHLFEQVHYLNIEHLRQVHALNQYLADQQIPFDHIIEDDLSCERLSDYAVVILPNTVFLSGAQLAALQTYLDGGGIVVAVGEVGTHDEYCRPREHAPFLKQERVISFDNINTILPHPGIFLETGVQAAAEGEFAETYKDPKLGKYLYLQGLDEKFRFKRFQEPGPLTPIIAKAFGQSPHIIDPWKASGVRSFVYTKSDGKTKRMAIHLVNKNVPLAVREEERMLQRISNFRVRIPVAQNVTIVSVRVFAPGESSPRIVVSEPDHQVLFDHLDAYAVLAVEFAG